MTLEDSIKFWRTEFTKQGTVDVDKFEKEYAYGIRYNYGKIFFFLMLDLNNNMLDMQNILISES